MLWSGEWSWRLVPTSGLRHLVSTRDGMSDRELIDDVAAWILQDNEQERRERAAGVKALFRRATATTTSGRAKELVKQGLSDRSGMIAFGTVPERFGKTAGVAKLIVVFQFQWQSGRQVAEMGETGEAHDLIGRRS